MPYTTQPVVQVVSRPQVDAEAIAGFLFSVGGSKWADRVFESGGADAELLVEFCGRICYRSWDVGLNPNVTKVRTDSAQYLRNILASGHGSVLEHANFSFVVHNVSRILTHELIRHRAGTAVSQESLRYVRLEDIPFWQPEWAIADDELTERSTALLKQMEEHIKWIGERYHIDDQPFHEKKRLTSYQRRFAPEGLTTSLVWTANIRSIRHVIEMRTNESAEEEIRLFANKVGQLMLKEAPLLFGDYEITDLEWLSPHRKV